MTKLKLTGHWPEWMNREEARICNKLISAILDDPTHKVAVLEGEENERLCEPTRDRATIQRKTAATEVTVYEVWMDTRYREGEIVRAGNLALRARVVLIHGNGEDVISDVSWDSNSPGDEDMVNKWLTHATGEPLA